MNYEDIPVSTQIWTDNVEEDPESIIWFAAVFRDNVDPGKVMQYNTQ